MPRVGTYREIDGAAVGLRIKEARAAAGLSQRQLAFPGCSAAYISRLEAGERVPSGHLLDELARRLPVTRTWLETGAADVAVVIPEDAVPAVVGYICEGLQEEWENRFAEGCAGGLSPVEYAVLPAIVHLLDENGQQIARDLLAEEGADRGAATEPAP